MVCEDRGPEATNDLEELSLGEGSVCMVDTDNALIPKSPASVQAREHPPNPLEHARIWSRTFFLWAYPLVRLGKERPLEDSDLPTLALIDSSQFQAKHLDQVRNPGTIKPSTRKENLARTLLVDYWKRTRLARWLLAGNIASRLVQTVALGRLLRLLDRPPPVQLSEAYGWAAVLVACGLVSFPTKQQQFFETYRVGVQLRVAVVAKIYSKILRLPSLGSGASNVTSGHVTNLASNDVERFLLTSVYCNFIVLGPIEALLVLVVGLYTIGPVFCAGYALLCLLVPFQFWLSRRFAALRDRIANKTDARIGLVSQAVHGARVMKQCGFETMFLDRIIQQRQGEIQQLQTTSRLKALNEAIYYFSNAVVATFIFSIHVAIGGTLTPEIVYTTLTLLGILQFTLTKHIPNAIMGLSECYVSCQRLQAFLELPDIATPVVHSSVAPANDSADNQTLLSLSNVTCYWNMHGSSDPSQSLKVALSDISLDLERGKLYCVIGKIGSGKSALLQAFSGELPAATGSIKRGIRSMTYAAQEAWIMDGSIRDNILMNLEFDQAWYEEVIDACALRHDLLHFPNGDETIVGDRGVQCSGGQKARIGLARAFYKQDSDIILLDDPLSAVDAKVAKTIFFSAIQKLGVQRGKCVVLVTHQHQFVGMADQCILMDDGKVTHKGTFAECQALSTFSNGNQLQMVESSDEGATEEVGLSTQSVKLFKEKQEEKRVTGIVKLQTWKAYADAFGGYWVFACLVFLFVATQATLLITFVLLGQWGDIPGDEQRSTKWFAIAGGVTSTLVVLSIVRALLSFSCLIHGSRRLHDAMTTAVLRAKISFFDTNPLGRILNRFSADVGIADEMLPLTIYDFLVGAFMFLGSVCTAIVVLPFVLLVLPPLAFFFIRLRSLFVATTRELKRLEGLARSPMYAMLAETMLGIDTIRAHGSTDHFSQKFSLVHDQHTRAVWAFMAASRWFATSLDILSFLLLTTATFVAVLLHTYEWLDVKAATLGLALTLLIQMANTNFPWMVRQSAEVSNQMVSVERILEFCQLESEAPLDLDSDKELPASWPHQGTIQVQELSVRYRTGLPLALAGINLTIDNGSRVGIVGRTGSGKSTLVQCLFRLLEAEGGNITIDGIDVARVGLHRLRKRISVIPQVPTLFSGCTIRENLDLFGAHSNEEIEKAIEDAHLLDMIRSLPSGVDSMVSEGGTNFSVGERQLLCLARAILSRNKILVLDEATANVDRRTDQLIQETLEKSFSDGTIIAVAHRLETIMDSDRVIVMGNGHVLEHDSPQTLLSYENGYFYAMAQSAGYSNNR